MDYRDLKLFYKTPEQDKKVKLIVTCEEGKEYDSQSKKVNTKIPPQSNNKNYCGILKYAALALLVFTLELLEPVYENL